MGWSQIANKNCLEVLAKLPNESIDAVISDPPYLISKPSNFNNGGGGITLKVVHIERQHQRRILENGIRLNLTGIRYLVNFIGC